WSPANSEIVSARSRSDAASDHPLDEREQHAHEHRRDDDADDDDVQRIELVGVALEILRLANAEERPEHGEPRPLERRRPAPLRTFAERTPGPTFVIAHDAFAPGVAGSAAERAGSTGVLPPTSKNVYDKVIVRTSFGSFLSMTKTTGQRFDSPGFSTCSVKQKHSSLRKCGAAACGA